MLSGCLATHHFLLTLLSPEISIVYSSDKSLKIETFVLAVALQSVFGHVVQLIGSKMPTDVHVLVYNPFLISLVLLYWKEVHSSLTGPIPNLKS